MFLGGSKQGTPLLTRRAKLGAEAALTASVVSDDAEDQLNLAADSCTLFDLRDVVKSHHFDALANSLNEVGAGLARVGVDDFGLSGEILGDFLHETNLVPGRAVKVASQNGQGFDNDRVGVAFDSIEWLDSREEATPYNTVEIGDENPALWSSILFSRFSRSNLLTLIDLRDDHTKIQNIESFLGRILLAFRVQVRCSRQIQMGGVVSL